MNNGRNTAPLSPPNSPRMSDASGKTREYQWQYPSITTHSPPTSGGQQSQHPPHEYEQLKQPLGDPSRPSLRSHRSFPYTLGHSGRLQQEVSRDEGAAPTLADFERRAVLEGSQPAGSSNVSGPSFVASVPNSPTGRLTPNSPGAGPNDDLLEDEDIGYGSGEQDDGEDRPPMTAAELRAHKRKMKRFRLTHNQTRFLMSEFARQAHPDAAHRERLSREIPGLSPRQVQVWFQNRRAKLKRLTTDDRERMMRSRALPADFDMSQALHSPFGAPPPPQNMGPPMPFPGNYSLYGVGPEVKPLTLDTLRRVPEYESYNQQYTSPTTITPALGAFAFTPPQSATETISPASAASNMSTFSFPPQESPRRPHYPGLPMGLGAGYGPHHPHMPRLHMHDRLSRPLGESAGSPLRTSMSYTGLPATQGQERASSYSEQTAVGQERPQQHRSLTNPGGAAAGPYGLGFSYPSVAPYQSSEPHQGPGHPAGPPMIAQQYRRGSGHLAGPPITTLPPYPPPQFASAHMPPYSSFGQFGMQAFQPHFQEESRQSQARLPQAQHHPQQDFASVPSQPHPFAPTASSSEHEAKENAADLGGLPAPRSY